MSKILVIEDNADNAILIRELFETAGHQLTVASTGQQGIEMATSDRPDIILLDIQLPDIDGTEVLKRIRASDKVKQIPIIAVTSYAMTGDRELLLDVGFDEYVEKPINVMAFLKIVEGILQRR
jgi:two-component system cell cycle response regulator DivK